ncbi:MAG: response regulator, partial [Anaerolineae bacterium]|nr:response regulator [Anaerolineae bacterium]
QELVRFVVKRALEKLGMSCELVTVDGGRAALDALEDDEFHLVVTDLKMPDVGGVELSEEIQPGATTPLWYGSQRAAVRASWTKPIACVYCSAWKSPLRRV